MSSQYNDKIERDAVCSPDKERETSIGRKRVREEIKVPDRILSMNSTWEWSGPSPESAYEKHALNLFTLAMGDTFIVDVFSFIFKIFQKLGEETRSDILREIKDTFIKLERGDLVVETSWAIRNTRKNDGTSFREIEFEIHDKTSLQTPAGKIAVHIERTEKSLQVRVRLFIHALETVCEENEYCLSGTFQGHDFDRYGIHHAKEAEEICPFLFHAYDPIDAKWYQRGERWYRYGLISGNFDDIYSDFLTNFILKGRKNLTETSLTMNTTNGGTLTVKSEISKRITIDGVTRNFTQNREMSFVFHPSFDDMSVSLSVELLSFNKDNKDKRAYTSYVPIEVNRHDESKIQTCFAAFSHIIQESAFENWEPRLQLYNMRYYDLIDPLVDSIEPKFFN